MQQKTDLRRVIIEVTNRCNLDCRMCLRNTWSTGLGTMSEYTFSSLLTDLGGFSTPLEVFFGGYGEPLSHPRIINMVQDAKRTGALTGLVTNGTLLTAGMAERLVASGLDKLWVSMDFFHHDALLQSTGENNQKNFKENLEIILASANGIDKVTELGLVYILSRSNLADIYNQLEFGQSLGVQSYFITNLEAYSPDLAAEIPFKTEHFRSPGAWRTVYTDLLKNLENIIKENPGVQIAGSLTDSSTLCPFAEKGDLVLRWDGQVSPCLPLLYDHSNHINGWEHRVQSFSFGSIADRSLREIWDSPEFVSFRYHLLEKDFSPCLSCRDCWLSNDNQQDCMGFEHPTCGGCLWAEGLVSCP